MAKNCQLVYMTILKWVFFFISRTIIFTDINKEQKNCRIPSLLGQKECIIVSFLIICFYFYQATPQSIYYSKLTTRYVLR